MEEMEEGRHNNVLCFCGCGAVAGRGAGTGRQAIFSIPTGGRKQARRASQTRSRSRAAIWLTRACPPLALSRPHILNSPGPRT